MNIFTNNNYKTSLLEKWKEHRVRKKSLTIKKLSQVIGVQYTYFSKVMNSENLHFNEDSLFMLCQYLEFFPEETEYLLLQRAYETSIHSERKKDLYLKMERIKKENKLEVSTKLLSSSSSIMKEMEYLFNPLCILIHVGLNCPHLQADPRLFCAKLGISVQQVKDILKILERNELIQIDPQDSFKILEITQKRNHFPKEHPLTRVHQHLLKIALQQQLQHTDEKEKESFLATFTMDDEGFNALKEEFQLFLKKAEQISRKSKNKNVYQLNFDLFRWL